MDSFNQYLKRLEKSVIEIIPFKDFQPNPQYESVLRGVELFRRERCDSIIAVGGGSAMDVAKCIKAYVNMDGNGENGEYLKQEIVPNAIPFLAMPTTRRNGLRSYAICCHIF